VNPIVKLPEHQLDQFNLFKQQYYDPDQLVRLHVISAKLSNGKDLKDCYCVVNVGPQKAETLKHQTNDIGEVKWDEHFSIEYYDKKEKESFYQLEVYANGQCIGIYKQRMSEISDSKEMWTNSKNIDCNITKDGKDTGVVTFRIRREQKRCGTLNIRVKDCELNEMAGNNVQSTRCVVKLSTFSQEALSIPNESKSSGNTSHFSFANDKEIAIDVNKNNNVFDVFIEVWQQNNALPIIGQARLPICDTTHNFKGNLPLLANNKMVGTVFVEANLKENKVEEKVNDHKDTK